MKKGITFNKDVFKRASSTKEPREFIISERTKSANKYQAAADFVASQKRTSNTKGQESELSKDWDRFSYKGSGSSVAAPATKSNIQDKPKQRKLSPAQRAQVEAHMRAQKKALTPASTLMTSEASSDGPAESNLKLEGVKPSGAGSARLLGEEGSDTGAGNAAMGHQAGAKVGSASLGVGATAAVDAGNANMGHQAGAKVGSASLGVGATADVDAGNANMGHQAGAKAGSASLEGAVTADVDAGNANMGHHADTTAGNAAMGHHTDVKSGSASLEGGATAEVDAGNAHMGHYADAKAGAASLDGKKIRAAGHADMGHHVGGRVSSASLDGEDVDGAAGQVNMGHQGSKQAGEKSLEGRNHKAVLSTTLGNTEAPKAAKNEKSVLPSRLAEKMSKIRAQSADITIDSDALQERSDKP
jgi:hypothetical protein